ncbi:MAG: MASE1 domain-containing protein, partial [Planctomycetes bacterium]|nr:MASE1 domain-containing protein [Planctomycetota bacterium]
MHRTGASILAHAALAVAMVAASTLSLGVHHDQLGAVVWIPTGVAVAGVWILGLRSAWVVLVSVFLQRTLWGYSATSATLAAVGSTLEALLAGALLRRFGVRGEFAALREVLVLLGIAAVTPLPSLAMSYVARSTFDPGWDGWWRMNVLGVLTVVPAALVWLRPGRSGHALGRLVPCLCTGAATAGLVTLVMLGVTPGTPAVLLLTMVLPIALWSALRYGTHGSITTATIGAVAITSFAGHGIGPFTSLPSAEQHVTVQILLVTLLSVPLVFGALIAEREATTTQWHESEAMRRAMVNALPDLMYKLRADGTFIDAMAPTGTETPVPATQLLG